jgi:flagellar hook-associated protein 1 FlgK
MPLSVSMEIAKSSLDTLQERTAVVSRNIGNAGNDYASRKIVHTVSAPGGGVRIGSIERATDSALFKNVLVANAKVGEQQEIDRALDRLNETIGDPEQDFSPAALVGKLGDALQQYSAGPQDPIRAKAVLDAATDMANGLKSATEATQNVRGTADAEIGRTVERLNAMFANVEKVNLEIVKGTRLGADVTDQLDTRDQLLTEIATEIGIKVVQRPDNDIAIYTDSGLTLFDNKARSITFDPTPVYDAGTTGNPLYIDGVAVTGPGATMPIGSGRLKGLADVRDTVTTTYQSQLDEIARGLIESFAESDQSGGGGPDQTGIFTYSGSPAVPATGTAITGLAREIGVSAAIDPNRGGDLNVIRDGGINGANYVYNTEGTAGFSARIFELADELEANRAFDPNAEAGSTDSLMDFASTSVGWLQQLRQANGEEFEFNQTVQQQSLDSLTQVVGVNLDYEMTILLEIERSYQATSRLISTIDTMIQSLLEAA